MAVAAAMVLLALTGGSAASADERRDPLRPPDFSRAAPQDNFNASAWSLGSTLVSSGRRIANINGQTVRPGDTVGGARVLAIHNGRVRLDYRGRRFTINRSLPEVRRESGS